MFSEHIFDSTQAPVVVNDNLFIRTICN
jgi:hypothetical protein